MHMDDPCSGYMYNASEREPESCPLAAIIKGIQVTSSNTHTYNAALALNYCNHTFFEREVREDMADEISEHRRLTNLGRPDGHGGLIFIGPRF